MNTSDKVCLPISLASTFMSINTPNQSNNKWGIKAESGERKSIVDPQKITVHSRHFSMHVSDITVCTQFTSAELCVAKGRKDVHQFHPLISFSFRHQHFSELFPSATAALSHCHGIFWGSLFLSPLFYAIFIFALFPCGIQ